MILTDSPCQAVDNRFLIALPRESYARLVSRLEMVSLSPGQPLCEPGERMKYVYFPTTCVVSMIYLAENGASTAVGVVGNEGAVGIGALLGDGRSLTQLTVQCGGRAARLDGTVLRDEFQLGSGVQRLLLRYLGTLFIQVTQTAVCNRLHSIEQQLCRWLLSIHDRVNANELLLTQESFSNLLGVRREGVTVAAGRLQRAGLIRYRRGHITIADRRGLEALTCECYRVAKSRIEDLCRG